jgi:hypothetical protein
MQEIVSNKHNVAPHAAMIELLSYYIAKELSERAQQNLSDGTPINQGIALPGLWFQIPERKSTFTL